MLKGKNILITGGTGSLGQALTKKLFSYNPKVIRIFSRNENNQINMKNQFNDKRLTFLIGDVRDKQRLKRAVEDIDIVIHTAALKHIDVGEYNPFEFIKTNIDGSQNVVDVCMDEEVEILLGISTDKAVSPLNLYVATKLTMEKLIVAANHYKGKRKTKFCCVRYGNVFGSSGSVVPKFVQQIQNKSSITITDLNMTRFNIEMEDALNFIVHALKITRGGEVFIPKLKSYILSDLVEALQTVSKVKFKIKKIPIRLGEKFHELLLSTYEVPYTIEFENTYILSSSGLTNFRNTFKHYRTIKIPKFKDYSSENSPKLSRHELEKLLKRHNYIP